jgi:hypothetical protein
MTRHNWTTSPADVDVASFPAQLLAQEIFS